MALHRKLITYLDGLEDLVNGRGYTTRHEEARKFVENACNSHELMVRAVEECIRAEMNRRKKILPGAPASDYTNARIAKLTTALSAAAGEE